jgi:hypothetical protein
MEWRPTFIKFWFTPRSKAMNVTTFKGTGPITSADMERLGTPEAVFSGRGCKFGKEFARQFIIISTNFCGDWGKRCLTLSTDGANSNDSCRTECVASVG